MKKNYVLVTLVLSSILTTSLLQAGKLNDLRSRIYNIYKTYFSSKNREHRGGFVDTEVPIDMYSNDGSAAGGLYHKDIPMYESAATMAPPRYVGGGAPREKMLEQWVDYLSRDPYKGNLELQEAILSMNNVNEELKWDILETVHHKELLESYGLRVNFSDSIIRELSEDPYYRGNPDRQRHFLSRRLAMNEQQVKLMLSLIAYKEEQEKKIH